LRGQSRAVSRRYGTGRKSCWSDSEFGVGLWKRRVWNVKPCKPEMFKIALRVRDRHLFRARNGDQNPPKKKNADESFPAVSHGHAEQALRYTVNCHKPSYRFSLGELQLRVHISDSKRGRCESLGHDRSYTGGMSTRKYMPGEDGRYSGGVLLSCKTRIKSSCLGTRSRIGRYF
jgi:hypothetical protein